MVANTEEQNDAVDAAEEIVSPPIEVSTSLLSDQFMAGFRVLLFFLTAMTAVAGFVKTRDLVGFIEWMKSAEVATGLATTVAFAVFVWSQYRTRKNKAEKIVLADAAPDQVGILKGR